MKYITRLLWLAVGLCALTTVCPLGAQENAPVSPAPNTEHCAFACWACSEGTCCGTQCGWYSLEQLRSLIREYERMNENLNGQIAKSPQLAQEFKAEFLSKHY